MSDKLQEIINEASIRTTIFEDSYIVEIRKESFDHLVEKAEKAEKLKSASSILNDLGTLWIKENNKLNAHLQQAKKELEIYRSYFKKVHDELENEDFVGEATENILCFNGQLLVDLAEMEGDPE
ncbi:hypothetical protein [Bacillus gobiensis]|uniref:Uncharacterized protein n=1 Tax=Bacillus gobiensis TaxID=1441095 RepID=A0A0M3R8X2_9BACI|nr:hypothetical protein [Bacillus gobiensis]ALC80426.1 hypothetical protein AM592_01625 [Bacillus gobiensis]